MIRAKYINAYQSQSVRLFINLLCFFILFVPQAAAEQPLANAHLEERAQVLFTQVRCMVCQGEVIKESNAALAVAMRSVIRTQIAQGWHDEQIIDYLVERYGMQVTTKPILNKYTAFLWMAPWLLLLWGVYFICRRLKVEHG